MQLSDEERRKIDLEFGRLAHERHANEWHALQRSTFDFALEGIRTSALINGGAVVACFAFMGSIFDGQTASPLIKALMWPSVCFAIGIGCAGIASVLAYLTQYFALKNATAVEYKYEYPYVRDSGSKWFERFGAAFHLLALAAVLLSYCSLTGGAYFVKQAIWP